MEARSKGKLSVWSVIWSDEIVVVNRHMLQVVEVSIHLGEGRGLESQASRMILKKRITFEWHTLHE